MNKLFAALPLLLAFGCTTRVVLGIDDGGISTGGLSMTSAAAASAGAVTTSGTTGGRSTDTGSTGGTSAGSTTGAMTGSSTGSTGGTATGDAGPCLPNNTECLSNDRCCSGSCDGACDQAFGKPCFADGDCGSGNCVNDQCACSEPMNGLPFGQCATDPDCCGGVCAHYLSQGDQDGFCCGGVGSGCTAPSDCCDESCRNGQCQCLPTGSPCETFANDCCSGICENEGSETICKVKQGDVCEALADCVTRNCDGGICGCGLSYAPCTSASECCPDFACASTPVPTFGTQVLDGGSLCCGDTGTACGPDIECCGACNNGTCACVPPGPNDNNRCFYTSGACCPGAACLPTAYVATDGIFNCCQLNAQPCFSFDECCTSFCAPDNTCACMPDGGQCSSGLTYSPLGSAACCSGVCGDGGECL